MNKTILKYEIKRLIFNKKFFYMVLIIGVLSYDFLTRLIIGGYGYSAPFSQLSYSVFMSMMVPFCLVVLFLFCTNVFSRKEINARKIVFSSPVTQTKYYTLKAAAILVSILIVSLVPIIMSFLFYSITFNYHNFLNFIVPIILFFLPPVFLAIGLFLLAGSISNKLLYILIPVIYFFSSFNFNQPNLLDFSGTSYLTSFSYTINPMLASSNILPNISSSFLISRLAFIVVGFVLFFITGMRKHIEK